MTRRTTEAVQRLAATGAPFFVWGVWALMLAARLVLTARYSNPSIPLSDEWFLLDSAREPVGLSWLWSQHAEHRIPLAKLIWLGVLRITDYDFRMGNFAAILAWAGLALAMIVTAKALRGRLRYSDAFFPLALLNLGQGLNFLWWWQVNHLLAPLVTCILLLIVVANGAELRPLPALMMAALLVVLTFCGPSGFPLVLAWAMWLGAWAYRRWRSPDLGDQGVGLWVAGLAALAVLLVGNYFRGLGLGGWPAAEGGYVLPTVALQLLSLSLGTGARPYWRESGIGVLALTAACMAVLLIALIRRPRERWRALGLLLFVGALLSLVIAVARARAGMSEDYIFFGTYVPLVVPILCCSYFVAELYLRPAAGRLVQLSLVGVAGILLPANVTGSVNFAYWVSVRAAAMETELKTGIPRSILAERYLAPEIFHLFPEERVVGEAIQLLGRLQAGGIGVFRHMRIEPAMRDVRLAAIPSATDQMTWQDGMGRGQRGPGRPSVTFSLDRPQFIYAIRVKLSYAETASHWATLEMWWGTREAQDRGDGSPPEGRRFGLTLPTDPARKVLKLVDGELRYDVAARDHVVTVWINDTIDQVRISPDAMPCVFTLSEIVLLMPADSATR